MPKGRKGVSAEVERLVRQFAGEGQSNRKISAIMAGLGYQVSKTTVGCLLRGFGKKWASRVRAPPRPPSAPPGSCQPPEPKEDEPDDYYWPLPPTCVLCMEVVIKEEIVDEEEQLGDEEWMPRQLHEFVRSKFNLIEGPQPFCEGCNGQLRRLHDLKLKEIQREYDELSGQLAEAFRNSSKWPSSPEEPNVIASMCASDGLVPCFVKLERIDGIGPSSRLPGKLSKSAGRIPVRPPGTTKKTPRTCSAQKPKPIKTTAQKEKHVQYQRDWRQKEREMNRSHQCEICGRSYKFSVFLRQHIRVQHKGERRYMCDVCGATATTSYCLTLHKVKHTGIPAYKCDYCDERFKVGMSKRGHMVKCHPIQHLCLKPLYCPHCWVTFRTEAEREEHHLRSHDKNTCKICDPPRVFKNADKYEQHANVHAGAKPFRCPLEGCERTFHGKQSLGKHKRRFHGIRARVRDGQT